MIASHNQGKVVSADLLRPLEIDIVGARELGLMSQRKPARLSSKMLS